MHLAYEALIKYGTPASLYIAGVVASRQGMDYIKAHFPKNARTWVGAIDDELSSKSYIVPGLGDAGDLAFGEKERVKKDKQ